MLAGVDEARGLLPTRRAAWALSCVEVVGVPREPVAERMPVDAELAPDLLLADLPVAAT